MAREFRFRMWDTEEKLFMNGSRIIESRINDLNKNDRWIYQQWTGLKDKNGKEIYEGDIVEFSIFDYNGNDTQYKGLVKYRSGLYEIWKNNDSEFFGSDGAFILNHAWLQDDEFEVIGNIYENPELLGESDGL